MHYYILPPFHLSRPPSPTTSKAKVKGNENSLFAFQRWQNKSWWAISSNIPTKTKVKECVGGGFLWLWHCWNHQPTCIYLSIDRESASVKGSLCLHFTSNAFELWMTKLLERWRENRKFQSQREICKKKATFFLLAMQKMPLQKIVSIFLQDAHLKTILLSNSKSVGRKWG